MESSGIANQPAGSPSAAHPDPYKWSAVGILVLFAFTLPVNVGIMLALRPAPPVDPWTQVAEQFGVDRGQVYSGSTVFQKGCAVCHGREAEGVPRLGKPLRNSAFVQEHTDDELFQVIAQGRLPDSPENTTGAVMPARANQGLGDDQLRDVIVYLRTIQDPSQPLTPIDDWVIDTTASATGKQAAGVAGVGHDLFVASCSACHGASGEGMANLGKPLVDSAFIDGQSDEELARFIKTGRPIWDPANTTGIDMPAKGGNPAITDEQIDQIIQYLRALHDQPGAE